MVRISSPMHTNIAVDVEFTVLNVSGNLHLNLLSAHAIERINTTQRQRTWGAGGA